MLSKNKFSVLHICMYIIITNFNTTFVHTYIHNLRYAFLAFRQFSIVCCQASYSQIWLFLPTQVRFMKTFSRLSQRQHECRYILVFQLSINHHFPRKKFHRSRATFLFTKIEPIDRLASTYLLLKKVGKVFGSKKQLSTFN